MRRACWVSGISGAILFLLHLSVIVVPEFVCLVAAVALFIGLAAGTFATAWMGVTYWRKSSRLWMAPSLLCVASLAVAWWLPRPLGMALSDWRFKNSLGSYAAVVDKVQKGDVSCTQGPCGQRVNVLSVERLQNRPAQVKGIHVVHCTVGTVLVVFYSDSDVPLYHAGYVYSSGDAKKCTVPGVDVGHAYGLGKLRHVTGEWYEFVGT